MIILIKCSREPAASGTGPVDFLTSLTKDTGGILSSDDWRWILTFLQKNTRSQKIAKLFVFFKPGSQ